MIKVKAPASTANLGPGFDVLGLALNLYQEVLIEKRMDAEKNTLWAQNIALPNAENLVTYAIEETLKYVHQTDLGYELTMLHSGIPMARGLGSSAAAIVCGVMCANALLDFTLSKDEVIQLATGIEGHSDNVVPAILGNATLSLQSENRLIYESFPFPKELKLMALIPQFELSTLESRKVLPKVYASETCLYNVSRMGLLIHALYEKKFHLLKTAFQDQIHQPFRLKCIPDASLIFEKFEPVVDGFFISGSGPTLMAVMTDEKCQSFSSDFALETLPLKEKWQICPLEVNVSGALYEGS